MCWASPGNQSSYVVMTRHFSVRVLLLSHDPRAKFVDNPWDPSIGVPAVLRDLECQMLYISKNLPNRTPSQLLDPSSGVPSQPPDPGSGTLPIDGSW